MKEFAFLVRAGNCCFKIFNAIYANFCFYNGLFTIDISNIDGVK